MKLWEFAAAGLLVSMVGCTPMQKKPEPITPPEKVSDLVDTGRRKAVVPVDLQLKPEQIDENNARDAAKRLEEEMRKDPRAN